MKTKVSLVTGLTVVTVLLSLFGQSWAIEEGKPFFPIQVNNSWTYSVQETQSHFGNHESFSGTGTRKVVDSNIENGIEFFTIREADDGFSTLAWRDDGLYFYGEYEIENGVKEEEQFDQPILILPAAFDIGSSQTQDFTRKEYVGGVLDNSDSGTWKVTLSAFENVTVAAGTFSDCLKVVIEQNSTNFDSNGEFIARNQGKLTLWLAKNVGLVKEQSNDTGFDENGSEIWRDIREVSLISSSLLAEQPQPTPIVVPTIAIEEENIQGEVFTANTVQVEQVSNSVPESAAILTQVESEVTVENRDNSRVTIKEQSLITQHPEQTINATEVKKVTLLRGTVELEAPANNKQYQVTTAIADIIVPASGTFRNSQEPVQFSTDYQQDGLLGTITLKVTSGSVIARDKNNNQVVLSAGSEITYQAMVNRTSWVLPVDNDKIFGGHQNLLSWQAYPGAAGYILEYNLPTPVFSEDNPSSVEFSNQAIRLKPGDYTTFKDLILFNVFIGQNQSSLLAEGRVFAIDSDGNVLAESVSSDKVTVTWE